MQVEDRTLKRVQGDVKWIVANLLAAAAGLALFRFTRRREGREGDRREKLGFDNRASIALSAGQRSSIISPNGRGRMFNKAKRAPLLPSRLRVFA